MTSRLERVVLAAGFALCLPALFIVWAIVSSVRVSWPTPPASIGWLLLFGGLSLYALALITFIRRTGKLPLNADPPAVAVVSGVYAWLSDPIYVGFGMACFGLAAVVGHAEAFWVVCPAIAAAMAALLAGYEGRRRPRRAGPATLDWPMALEAMASDRSWRATLLNAAILIGLGTVVASGFGAPRATWTFGVAPLAAGAGLALMRIWGGGVRETDLRALLSSAFIAGGVTLVVFAGAFPTAPWDMSAAAAILGASATLSRRWWVRSLNLLIAASVVASAGVEALAVLAALGFAVFAGGVHARIVKLAERIANGWAAFQLGPIRVINYAGFAALAAFVGTVVFNLTLGAHGPLSSAMIAICVLAGGAIWGRLIESTGRLARPFGYFGAVLGGVLGVVAASLLTETPLLSLGASLALGATWTQAIGRLRCLVQGCCHGRPILWGVGIRYLRPESRAVALSKMGGEALYPTPVFSIYANLLSSVVLSQLYWAVQGASVVLGVYLLIAGLGRFAEEGFRGEPQTRHIRGLTIYQWLSIGQAVAGLGLTMVEAPPLGGPHMLDAASWSVAIFAALMAGFAMGVDFPRSRRPLARLTPDAP